MKKEHLAYFSRVVTQVQDEAESRELIRMINRYDYLFQVHDSINDLHNTKKVMSEHFSNGNPTESIVGFSRTVRVGPYISVGGTAPVDADGKTVGLGDPTAQSRRCLEIILRPWRMLVRACMTWSVRACY